MPDLGNIERICGPVWYNPHLDEIASRVLSAAKWSHDIGLIMWFAYIASSRFTQHLRKNLTRRAMVYYRDVEGSPVLAMDGEQTLVHPSCDFLRFRPGEWELGPEFFPRMGSSFVGTPVQSFAHISYEPNGERVEKEEKEETIVPNRFWVWFSGMDYDNDYYNCAEMFVIDVLRKLVYDPQKPSQGWVSVSVENFKGYAKKYR
jgi:hypothetical protein